MLEATYKAIEKFEYVSVGDQLPRIVQKKKNTTSPR